jgi:hypothetical protein
MRDERAADEGRAEVTDLKPLGVTVAIAGLLIAFFGFIAGFFVNPYYAPQQTVQELRYVIAAIGTVLFALGIVIFQLEDGRVARRRDRGLDELLVSPDLKLSGRTRSCPQCTSRIRIESKVCRFCSRDIEPSAQPDRAAQWGAAFADAARPPS